MTDLIQNPKIYLKTYGCQMNVRDSEQVASMFVERGYDLTTDENDADVLLINTCSIRDQAENKAIGKMGMLGKQFRKNKNKDQQVFAYMGCMAQSRKDELLKISPHVNLIVGTQKYHKVVDYVDEILVSKGMIQDLYQRRMNDLRSVIIDVSEEKNSQNTIKDHLNGSSNKSQLSIKNDIINNNKVSNPSEFVSIMQGCDMKCSYCIVPTTRGHERSRPIEDILYEIQDLVDRGVKQVTLLGQIVNLYGRFDLKKIQDKSPFVFLLEEIQKIKGIEIIRFVSPHPQGFDDDLINSFGYLSKLASHIHLPLQSGSNAILKSMKRTYTVEHFKNICTKLRKVRPDIAITTDIIVGYPGETEDDFIETKNLIDEIQFDNAYVFRYSPRTGTRSAKLPKDLLIDDEVKKQRNKILLNQLSDISRKKNSELIGKNVNILCEGRSRNNMDRFEGRNSQNKIFIFDSKRNDGDLIGKFLDLKVTKCSDFTIYGELC